MGWFIFGGDITNGKPSEPPKRGRPLGSKNTPKPSGGKNGTKKKDS